MELVDPPEGTPVGARLSVKGFEGEPDAELNPKQKVFEKVKPVRSFCNEIDERGADSFPGLALERRPCGVLQGRSN